MKTRLAVSLLVLTSLANASSDAQEPALSGLAVEPTPSSAVSLTPSPSPAITTLSGGKAPIPGAARGSSLADVVKLSKENRKDKDQPPKKSLGAITNESLLKGAAPKPTASKGAPAKGTPAKPAPAKITRGAASPTPTPYVPDVSRDDKGRSEDDWKALMGQQKALVTGGEARIRQLETKTKQLENDFYAMSDGNRRDAVVKPAWDRSREELTKARQELEDARRALDALSEDARKSNTPPGWLR